MRRLFVIGTLFLAIALTGPIACGKRGDLQPPEGKPSKYPRTYPAT
jgi:hypothetical protein